MKTFAECQDWIQRRAVNPYYAERYRWMEPHYLPMLIGELDELTPGCAIDVGPGWGTMLCWLTNRGWDVSALDWEPLGTYIAPQTIEDLRRETRRDLHYIHGDIFDPPSMGEPADLVLMTQVVPHMKWRADHALANVARMMRDDGLFICSVLDRADYPNLVAGYGDSWRSAPQWSERATVTPTPETVTVMYRRDEFADLLGSVFPRMEVYKPFGTACLFGRCGK